MSEIGNPDVFDASIASGLMIESSSANTRCFSSSFSGTASMMRSQSRRSASFERVVDAFDGGRRQVEAEFAAFHRTLEAPFAIDDLGACFIENLLREIADGDAISGERKHLRDAAAHHAAADDADRVVPHSVPCGCPLRPVVAGKHSRDVRRPAKRFGYDPARHGSKRGNDHAGNQPRGDARSARSATRRLSEQGEVAAATRIDRLDRAIALLVDHQQRLVDALSRRLRSSFAASVVVHRHRGVDRSAQTREETPRGLDEAGEAKSRLSDESARRESARRISAARCRRRDQPVEFPGESDVHAARRHSRRRQPLHDQTVGIHARHVAGDGRNHRRRVRRTRNRRGRRRSADRRRFCRSAVRSSAVHRRDVDRASRDARGGGKPGAGHARTRRQIAGDRRAFGQHREDHRRDHGRQDDERGTDLPRAGLRVRAEGKRRRIRRIDAALGEEDVREPDRQRRLHVDRQPTPLRPSERLHRRREAERRAASSRSIRRTKTSASSRTTRFRRR